MASEQLLPQQNNERRELEPKIEEESTKMCSIVKIATKELPLVKEEEISTLALLRVSNLVLHVLDQVGPTMLVLRQELQRNVERIEDLYVLDPALYLNIEEILKKEARDGTSKQQTSCSKAILWLTRTLNFSLALLQNLEDNHESRLEQIVEETYNNTLKPYHGWISSAAYKVALKLIPEREAFVALLMGEGQNYNDLKDDIKNLASVLLPLLVSTNALLKKYKLDRLKSS